MSMPRKMRKDYRERELEAERKGEIHLERVLEEAGFSPERIEREELMRGPTERLREYGPQPRTFRRELEEAKRIRIMGGYERSEPEVPVKRFSPEMEYEKVYEWIKKGKFPSADKIIEEISKLPENDPVKDMLFSDLKLPEKSFKCITDYIRNKFSEGSPEEIGFLLWNLNRAAQNGPINKSMFTDAKNNLHVVYQLEGKLVHFIADLSKGEMKVEAPVLPRIGEFKPEQREVLFRQVMLDAHKKFGDRVSVHSMLPGEPFRKLEHEELVRMLKI